MKEEIAFNDEKFGKHCLTETTRSFQPELDGKLD